MAIAIYQDTETGRHHFAEPTSKETKANLASGEWVLFDDTPSTPPPPGDPIDTAFAQRIKTQGSATALALGAAYVAGRVLNSNGSVNAQKKLTVKLTADGLDIDDLIIEDVA